MVIFIYCVICYVLYFVGLTIHQSFNKIDWTYPNDASQTAIGLFIFAPLAIPMVIPAFLIYCCFVLSYVISNWIRENRQNWKEKIINKLTEQ